MIPAAWVASMGGVIGKRTAEIVASIAPYLLAAVLIAAAFALGRCDGVSDEKARQAAATAKANEKALTRDAGAKEQAATERAIDTGAIEAQKKDQIDALQGDSNTLRVRAACQRLRAAGRSAADLPEPCRPQGGS